MSKYITAVRNKPFATIKFEGKYANFAKKKKNPSILAKRPNRIRLRYLYFSKIFFKILNYYY